jgi:hypothetical protein
MKRASGAAHRKGRRIQLSRSNPDRAAIFDDGGPFCKFQGNINSATSISRFGLARQSEQAGEQALKPRHP